MTINSLHKGDDDDDDDDDNDNNNNNSILYYKCAQGRDIVVGTATPYGVDGPGI